MSMQIRGVSKSFFNVPVLKSVSLTIERGKILGLVGENGAGKSTLMNILGGNLQADAGQLVLDGAPYVPRSPREALAAGVDMVHQELNLFPNLSVADNLFLVNYPRSAGIIRRRKLMVDAQAALRRVGLDVSPSARLGSLSAGEQQLVEIAKSLALGATLLLFDEPTTSLSDRECKRFFDLIHAFAEQGHAIVLITHAIGDVVRHCDRVAVLRDGEMVSVQDTDDTNADRLVAEMVGRSLTQMFPSRSEESSVGEPLLQIEQLSQPKTVRDVSLTVHRGEVVGIFGLMGSGRSELARILMGVDPHRSGRVLLQGEELRGGPRGRIARGLGLVTESRRHDGIVAESSVEENMALVAIDAFAGFAGNIDRERLSTAVRSQRDGVKLQEHLQDAQLLKTLSGGNQQKVVIGKWLLKSPQVLILDEPTRGIDVGAKLEVYQLMLDLAKRGAGVLVISSDLEELLGTCDRILVMSLGRVTGSYSRAEFDRENIMASALVHHMRAAGVAT